MYKIGNKKDREAFFVEKITPWYFHQRGITRLILTNKYCRKKMKTKKYRETFFPNYHFGSFTRETYKIYSEISHPCTAPLLYIIQLINNVKEKG